MWLWEAELRQLGFRRRSERYWRCEGRHGLPALAHLSIWSWSEQVLSAGRHRQSRFLVEVTEFHVTFLSGFDHLHFYYHEHGGLDWEPGGHTSPTELCRLGEDPLTLRARADAIAGELIACWGGRLLERQRPCRQDGRCGEDGA